MCVTSCLIRVQLKHPVTAEEKVLHLRHEDEKNEKLFKDPAGLDLEVVDKVQLTEWLVNNFMNFGATLEFVTNRSQEGSQFQRGFGGIGGKSKKRNIVRKFAR